MRDRSCNQTVQHDCPQTRGRRRVTFHRSDLSARASKEAEEAKEAEETKEATGEIIKGTLGL